MFFVIFCRKGGLNVQRRVLLLSFHLQKSSADMREIINRTLRVNLWFCKDNSERKW